MNDEIKFEQVVSDILHAIDSIKYDNDVHKELLKYEILQVIFRMTETIDIFRDDIDILNQYAINGTERIKKVK